jgi:hypothetical protein
MKKKKLANEKYCGPKRTLLKVLWFAMLVLPLPAFAALGASLDSVRYDQARMGAKVVVTIKQAYSVHELRSPLAIVVREYVSSDGRVFAVSWQGPFMPDMRQLLGSYFEQYSSATQAQRVQRIGRLPLSIRYPSLVLQSVGHMRAYSGRAYDPALLPTGVSADAIR